MDFEKNSEFFSKKPSIFPKENNFEQFEKPRYFSHTLRQNRWKLVLKNFNTERPELLGEHRF